MLRMSNLWILTSGTRVSLEQAHLVVRLPKEGAEGCAEAERHSLPLEALEHVVVGEGCVLTTPALVELLRRRIPVDWVDHSGEPLASVMPPEPPQARSRLSHYQAALDPGRGLGIAAALVGAKLHNMKRLLQRMASRRKESATGAAAQLDALSSALGRCTQVDGVMGMEGQGTACFLEHWAAALPEAFPLERRSRRPPHNPVNACLSFASVLLTRLVNGSAHASGLDPAIGFLHANGNGRWNLALDLMEPFRPMLVEALVLDLFTHGRLDEGHFVREPGSCLLNAKGRRIVVEAHECRLGSRFRCEATEEETCLRERIRHEGVHLRNYINGVARQYRPFRLG